MPMLRFSMGTWVMSLPCMLTVPLTGSMKPVMVRSVVVLPQPEGPRKVKNSPSFTCTLMLCIASKSSNLTTISVSLIMLRTPLSLWFEEKRARSGPLFNDFLIYASGAAWVRVAQSRLSQSGSAGASALSAQ